MWKYFKFDENSESIRHILLYRTIQFVHDGSYMQNVAFMQKAALTFSLMHLSFIAQEQIRKWRNS